jgi:hypothetical protein
MVLIYAYILDPFWKLRSFSNQGPWNGYSFWGWDIPNNPIPRGLSEWPGEWILCKILMCAGR